jgi:hypothetical protein
MRGSPRPRPPRAPVDAQLPAKGDGFTTYNRESEGQDQWATARTVASLMRIGSAWHERYPERPLEVGDISRAGGGKFVGHKLHRVGIDVDIRPPTASGGAATWRDPGYDRRATRDLIAIIKKENPDARIVFNDPVLIREGLTHAAGGHDNHLHVSFR